MTRPGLALTPLRLALRRLRRTPAPALLLAVSVAAAAALLGWSGFAAALAQERSVRLRLEERTPAQRAFRVRYFVPALQPDSGAAAVAAETTRLRDVASRPHVVRIGHPVAPDNDAGVRVVTAAPSDLVLDSGRLPRGCEARICEAIALAGQARGDRIRLGRRAMVVVVGEGSLRSVALADTSLLGRRAVFVLHPSKALRRVVATAGSTVVVSAPLVPGRIHGFAVRRLSERLRASVVRLDRADLPGLVQATAPFGLLDELASRGRAARTRLLLVAGEAAALLLAFAAFAARARREDLVFSAEQLSTLGASPAQIAVARFVEIGAPCIAGTAAALCGLEIAARLVAETRNLPRAFVAAALPGGTLLAIAAVGVAAAVIVFAATFAPRRVRGIGVLELAGIAALALVAWQTAASGALDPARVVAEGPTPVLLLLPALAFFAGGVLLLRILPPALRLGERAARQSPFALRLAFVAAARRPLEAAAVTTFLAVALGGALFALDYRATLQSEARDEAAFTAGGSWRVVERGGATPLTRFARVTRERPTPVLRLDAQLLGADPSAPPLPVQILGVPAERLPEVGGWRDSYSPLPRTELARRLRPRPVRLTGPLLARDATAVRAWVRAQTSAPRGVVLHLLLPGGGFAHVRFGLVWNRWQLLRTPVMTRLRGARLVGIEFLPTVFPLTHPPDLAGSVDVAGVAECRGGRWVALPSLAGWVPAAPGGELGAAGFVDTSPPDAPAGGGFRFDLNGTLLPLAHPPVPVPHALPAVAGPAVAAAAVDRLVTVDIPGGQLRLRIVGRSQLFPTVTDAPTQFLAVDYDTLFAALNVDSPGRAVASEAWFFAPKPRSFAAALARPPFRLERAVGRRALETRLTADPLAAGTRRVLDVAAVVAAVLALLGLVLATRATLAGERVLLAEQEALGIAPSTLRRAARARLLALCAVGVVAGLLGGIVALRLVAAFVAVAGTGAAPLPPIASAVAWAASVLVLVGVLVVSAGAVGILVRQTFTESPAQRLRA